MFNNKMVFRIRVHLPTQYAMATIIITFLLHLTMETCHITSYIINYSYGLLLLTHYYIITNLFINHVYM